MIISLHRNKYIRRLHTVLYHSPWTKSLKNMNNIQLTYQHNRNTLSGVIWHGNQIYNTCGSGYSRGGGVFTCIFYIENWLLVLSFCLKRGYNLFEIKAMINNIIKNTTTDFNNWWNGLHKIKSYLTVLVQGMNLTA